MWVMKNKVTMNIIKSIYKFTGVAVLAVVLSSCGNDWLDISPSNGTDADGPWYRQMALRQPVLAFIRH